MSMISRRGILGMFASLPFVAVGSKQKREITTIVGIPSRWATIHVPTSCWLVGSRMGQRVYQAKNGQLVASNQDLTDSHKYVGTVVSSNESLTRIIINVQTS